MKVDPSLEIPLFVQIATQIRSRIASGDLRGGDVLPSLRDGADEWNVNLHTVRRAYESLGEEGLVETRPRSRARIVETAPERTSGFQGDMEHYFRWIRQTAYSRFALNDAELVRHLSASTFRAEKAPTIWVLECSASMTESLAWQIRNIFYRDVQPWPVHLAEDVPFGDYLTTLFHYQEVNSVLAKRGAQTDSFTVHLEFQNLLRLRNALDPEDPRLIVCGIDCITSRAIASDIETSLPGGTHIISRVTTHPVRLIDTAPGDIPVLVSPQNWDRLPETYRRLDRVFPLAVEVDSDDIKRIGNRLGWRRLTRSDL